VSADETPVEEPERSSRAAGGCVLVIGLGVAGGVVHAVPEVGYTVAGALAVVAVGKARTWAAGRRQDADEAEADEQEPVDIVAVLQALGDGGQHVRLTQLQEATGLPDTKAVRALLDEAGITIRSGVRAGGKNGPGVHADDIPRFESAGSSGCLCRSDANANTNNTAGEGPEKGFRVEHTGHAGVTVYDLSETHHRHHKLTGAHRG
jgi:pyruvate/2-oxoglutarate dehydrogenase complex dihydrolipoamide acyltransferase (E2) component